MYIITAYKMGKKSSVQGLNFCPQTDETQLALFANFFVPLRSLSDI